MISPRSIGPPITEAFGELDRFRPEAATLAALERSLLA
jgi:hypothetical protein